MILNFDEQFISASTLLPNCVFVKSKDDLLDDYFNDTIGLVVRLGINLDDKFLCRFSKLKFIASITTGLDHIDREYCLTKNISIISLKGEYSFLKKIRSTPEHNWLLILAISRKMLAASNDVLKGNWNRKNYFGHELYKKNLGILGYGRVGKIISQYAISFGMKVYVNDIKKIESQNVHPVSVNKLFKISDYLSINLPLNRYTRHFVDYSKMSKMKKESFLINTSRGAIINQEDLIKILSENKISGAAIDVIEEENDTRFNFKNTNIYNYSLKNDNLIITPHIAGSSYESMETTADFISKKILEYLK